MVLLPPLDGFDTDLHQLNEILKMHVLIYREFVVVDEDVVVLHFAVGAHTQCVVAGEVVALPYQEQAVLM